MLTRRQLNQRYLFPAALLAGLVAACGPGAVAPLAAPVQPAPPAPPAAAKPKSLDITLYNDGLPVPAHTAPHNLLNNRIVDLQPGQRVVGIENVTVLASPKLTNDALAKTPAGGYDGKFNISFVKIRYGDQELYVPRVLVDAQSRQGLSQLSTGATLEQKLSLEGLSPVATARLTHNSTFYAVDASGQILELSKLSTGTSVELMAQTGDGCMFIKSGGQLGFVKSLSAFDKSILQTHHAALRRWSSTPGYNFSPATIESLVTKVESGTLPAYVASSKTIFSPGNSIKATVYLVDAEGIPGPVTLFKVERVAANGQSTMWKHGFPASPLSRYYLGVQRITGTELDALAYSALRTTSPATYLKGTTTMENFVFIAGGKQVQVLSSQEFDALANTALQDSFVAPGTYEKMFAKNVGQPRIFGRVLNPGIYDAVANIAASLAPYAVLTLLQTGANFTRYPDLRNAVTTAIGLDDPYVQLVNGATYQSKRDILGQIQSWQSWMKANPRGDGLPPGGLFAIGPKNPLPFTIDILRKGNGEPVSFDHYVLHPIFDCYIREADGTNRLIQSGGSYFLERGEIISISVPGGPSYSEFQIYTENGVKFKFKYQGPPLGPFINT
ncbi:MAG: hypothetical protein V1859_03210 [archaeon]